MIPRADARCRDCDWHRAGRLADVDPATAQHVEQSGHRAGYRLLADAAPTSTHQEGPTP